MTSPSTSIAKKTAKTTGGPSNSRRSVFFFFSSRRRHTRCGRDWSSDVCSSDLLRLGAPRESRVHDAPEILWGLPAEVVPLVPAPGDEHVRGAAAAPPGAVEIQSVTVGGEAGDAVVPGRVDVRPEVNRLAPGGVDARPL